MSNNILKVENATMQFGGVVAVDNLNLEVNEGEIVALIGPNGAGKTTAFNVITGVYQPTNGAVWFLGDKIVENHPQGKMKKLYKGEHAGEYSHVLAPTPDHITKLGMARTFQNIRLWKSQTVFDNVLIAMHCRTPGPIKCLLHIHLHAKAFVIEISHLAFCQRIALFCQFQVPFKALLILSCQKILFNQFIAFRKLSTWLIIIAAFFQCMQKQPASQLRFEPCGLWRH